MWAASSSYRFPPRLSAGPAPDPAASPAFCNAEFRTACFTDDLSWGEMRERKPLYFRDFRPRQFS